MKMPYENFSLKNIKGEQWRDINGYDGYYQVSTFGRVKSMARLTQYYRGDNLISVLVKERILKQRLLIKQNQLSDTQSACLSIRLSLPDNPKKQRFCTAVSRLVYDGFLSQNDTASENLIIYHKDENPLNNRIDNLLPITKSARLKIAFENGRLPHVTTLGKWNTTANRRQYASNKFQPVTQYTMNGDIIAVYENMQEASRKTGIFTANIRRAIQGEIISAGGSLWAKGKGNFLDMEPIKERLRQYKKRNCKTVSQYDLAGNYIKTFTSIAGAAKEIKGSPSFIKLAMNGKRPTAYNYIWKVAAS